MFSTNRVARAIVLGGLALWAGSTPAQDTRPAHAEAPNGQVRADAPRVVTPAEKRAAALLERAVRHIEAHGEAGVAAFGRDEQFIDRDLYVYALRTDGRFLSSGGFSAALVGTNVLDYTDVDGKAFFRDIVAAAREQGGGRVEYKWFNPADSRGEPKVTLFRKVGDLIVAVGYFSPRATPTDAKAMLRAATKAVDADPRQAFVDFQRADGRFVRDDLYVFAVDLANGRFVAHGAQPRLVGADTSRLVDSQGRPIIPGMIARLGDGSSAEFDYLWVNPVSGRTEAKRSFLRRSGDMLVGVGYYTR